jgi:predicted PurR-regulated permease PerM
MNDSRLYFRTFVVLLLIVTLAFGWLLLPYYDAIFWGAILAISFIPLHRRLQARFPRSPNLTALGSVLICLLIVILPVTFLISSLLQEGLDLYKRIESGQINLGAYFRQIINALPPDLHELLDHYGLADILSIQDKLSDGSLQASRFLASQAVNLGQNTFGFVIDLGIMLYLLFFLFRDGAQLMRKTFTLIPLSGPHKQLLIQKFVAVVRATIKGNIVVAATQGALGGLIFWFLGIQGALLWGVVMAFLSLLPAVGAALVWLPVAVYYLVTGDYMPGIILTAYGVLVIGLVDNLLRPILVGKDTKMPDYVILISTLGGLATFGLNGFVIGPLIAALFMAVWALLPSASQDS